MAKRRFWTVTELRAFAGLYPIMTNGALAARFGRSYSAIKNLGQTLDLHKTKGHLLRHSRLRPGHPAWCWNKGKRHAPEGSRATQFKKGQRSQRQRPVGAERVGCDGFEIKVAEPNVWMPKGRAVWTQHFGQIPAGMIVRFNDGNQLNCAPENLRLVTRAEHIRLNWKPRGAARREPSPPTWTAPVLRVAHG